MNCTVCELHSINLLKLLEIFYIPFFNKVLKIFCIFPSLVSQFVLPHTLQVLMATRKQWLCSDMTEMIHIHNDLCKGTSTCNKASPLLAHLSILWCSQQTTSRNCQGFSSFIFWVNFILAGREKKARISFYLFLNLSLSLLLSIYHLSPLAALYVPRFILLYNWTVYVLLCS